MSFGGSELELLRLLIQRRTTNIVIQITKNFCQLRWISLLGAQLLQTEGVPLCSRIFLLAWAKVAVLHLLLQYLQKVLVITALKILQFCLQCLLVQAAELHGV